MTQRRAKRGGEYGANGEFYEGWKFINTTPENAKRYGSTPKGTRKQEIEPYKWEYPPTENATSLFRRIAGILAKFNWEENRFDFAASAQTLDYLGMSKAEAEQLIELYNTGTRWIERA